MQDRSHAPPIPTVMDPAENALPPRVPPGRQARLLAARAAALGDQVASRPADPGYASVFTEALLARLPPSALARLFHDLWRRVGACVRTELVTAHTTRAGVVECVFERGDRLEASLALEGAPPHRIDSFTLGEPRPVAATAEALAAAAAALPGQVSLLVQPRTGPPLIDLAADVSLAVGSVFKLWVLCALLRCIEAGDRDWGDVVHAQARHRSMTSGLMHRWPSGAPLTLHTLASLMIGLSDNTAADHLLDLLGRDAVLRAMETTGHGSVARNDPLLSTLEAAKLKGSAPSDHGRRYAEASLSERRRILAHELEALVVGDLSVPERPQHIDRIEWFASVRDICRALDWLRGRAEVGAHGRVARDVMAINGGLSLSERAWSYVGFKGGSEAGVLSAAYLLRRRRDDAWIALAATWNDGEGRTDTDVFFDLVRGALQVADA